MEHGIIIRDLNNENNSAEKELEDYFDARIEEDQPTMEEVEEIVEEKVEEKAEEVTESE
jgi:ABC-2 type transport system ATP-binding protein